MSRKYWIISALMFVVDFFSTLFKELKKRNVTEEMIFDALKSKDLIPQMAGKIADLIAGISLNIVSFFQNQSPVKLWLGDNFKNWILTKQPDNFSGSPKTTKIILPKRMTDAEIIKEYKITPYSISEVLKVLYDKISKQPNGENGELLSNGYANLFYVELNDDRLVVVDADWSSGDSGWDLDAFDLDGYGWYDGLCVFSRS